MSKLRSALYTSQVLIPQNELLDVVQRPVAARLEAQRFGGVAWLVGTGGRGAAAHHQGRHGAASGGCPMSACTSNSFESVSWGSCLAKPLAALLLVSYGR